MIKDQRAQILNEGRHARGPVVYWMSRDQRVADNWALLFAQDVARKDHAPLAVIFSLSPRFPGATIRQYNFMLHGLEEVEGTLDQLNIRFFLLAGPPDKEIPAFVRKHQVGTVVTDFSPLRIHREWKNRVSGKLGVPFYEVDAHNIVPCRLASDKREYAAATFRPKLNRLLPTFLDEMPQPVPHSVSWKGGRERTDWKRVWNQLTVDTSVMPVDWIVPGEAAARSVFDRFLKSGLPKYGADRNDPTKSAQSNLSPYLHFGHISPQRVALEVSKEVENQSSRDAFLEELIVRRELSDNFCFYADYYDSIATFPSWAQRTLNKHERDRRPHLYSPRQFERGATHDALWNAAQIEMLKTGKMHGFMRMYWAKKILEWSPTPELALRTAIWLNDKYELDGRDPNGYAGIAWSIGGVHDRAWGERSVFGKLRYMSADGCRRKFDVDRYISLVQGLR